MAKWIQPARVRAAIAALAEWREKAKSQPAMHLWPLLALIEKGATSGSFTEFQESDDFAFWDRYGRLPGETRTRGDTSEFIQKYYVDPLVRLKKPSDYPHRSPSTIRRRTFLNSWKAAENDPKDENQWRLAKGFADKFVSKVLEKNDAVERIPVVDLATWLFRVERFQDSATAKTLEQQFLERFPFSRGDYDKLFVFVNEAPDRLFVSEEPTPEEYKAAIEDALVEDTAPLPTPPPLYPEGPGETPALDDDDAIFRQVRDLLALGSSGIILRGCPGTSKTWYAKQIARKLATSEKHIFQIQFHPSFGYEDFVEGYRPDDNSKSGFKVVDKIFLEACDVARQIKSPAVFIIDEINRGDPARVFGELLTYIEFGYRGDTFRRAYTGNSTSVPANLVILGTMNLADRSITQIDLALMRRFDHIDLNPSAELVELFLQRSGEFTPEQVDRVSKWFVTLQRFVQIGHTYFKDVVHPEQIRTIWHYRMLPYCEAVLELDPQKLENVRRTFDAMYKALIGQAEEEGE